jgi:hypothetical protein
MSRRKSDKVRGAEYALVCKSQRGAKCEVLLDCTELLPPTEKVGRSKMTDDLWTEMGARVR